MNAAIFLYLADVIGNLNVFFASVSIIWLTCAIVFTGVCAVENGKYHNKNWIILAPLAILAASCFIPSSKTMYMMAGAVIGEQALESKAGQQIKEMLEFKLQQELDKMKQGEKK